MSTVQSEHEKVTLPKSPVTSYLVLSDATAAIDFYKRAFDAVVAEHHFAQDGKRVMHATLVVNGGVIMLSDEFPEFSGQKPANPLALGGSSVVIQLELADADAVWQKAVAAGATVEMPLADQFWGDRYGVLRDPFGHRWVLYSHKTAAKA
jgi:PhnB protein